MVRPDQSEMGQGGLCGVTSPNIESLPLMASPTSSAANGIASEVQDSLSSLLSVEGSTGLSLDDLVMKLRSVINENLELKETVAQNNLALRQQLGLVVQWRQQHETQLQQQRQQVAQVTTQLNTLHRENQTLKAQLASSKVPEEGQARFHELSETVRMLNTRMEAAQRILRQTQDDKEKLAAQRSRLEGDITLLKCDLTSSRSEQERLQLERFELVSAANDLRQQLRQAREGAAAKARTTPSPVYEGALGIGGGELEVYKLRDQLHKEQDTSTTLLQELHDTRTQVDVLESEVLRAKEEAALHREMYRKLQARADTLPTSSPLVQAPTSPNTDPFKKEADDALEKKHLRDEAAMLREEVDTLETALSTERVKTSEDRAALSRAHAELTKLKKELQEVKDRSERETHNDQYYQIKIKSMTEKHDEATAKLMSYEELLAAKNEDLARLKKELGQTKAALAERTSEKETIAILRAQVEVYQGDFRAEREAREALATDREKLRDDIRHLQTRNIQLVDELEAYQRRHLQPGVGGGSRGPSEERFGGFGSVGTIAGGGGGSSGPTAGALLTPLTPEALWDKLSNTSDKKEEERKKEEEIDENLFYCPKCNKSFTQYQPLEDHVNRCLDED